MGGTGGKKGGAGPGVTVGEDKEDWFFLWGGEGKGCRGRGLCRAVVCSRAEVEDLVFLRHALLEPFFLGKQSRKKSPDLHKRNGRVGKGNLEVPGANM